MEIKNEERMILHSFLKWLHPIYRCNMYHIRKYLTLVYSTFVFLENRKSYLIDFICHTGVHILVKKFKVISMPTKKGDLMSVSWEFVTWKKYLFSNVKDDIIGYTFLTPMITTLITSLGHYIFFWSRIIYWWWNINHTPSFLIWCEWCGLIK